jgi:hypothetical protein
LRSGTPKPVHPESVGILVKRSSNKATGSPLTNDEYEGIAMLARYLSRRVVIQVQFVEPGGHVTGTLVLGPNGARGKSIFAKTGTSMDAVNRRIRRLED